jgi:hypothetical protein
MQAITVDAVFEKVTSIYDSLKVGDANAGSGKWNCII